MLKNTALTISKKNHKYLSEKTSIYFCKNKLGEIKDIANIIRENQVNSKLIYHQRDKLSLKLKE